MKPAFLLLCSCGCARLCEASAEHGRTLQP